MRVVSFETGKATLLVHLEEMLPLDGYDSRVIFDSIVERYNFSIGPDFSVSRESQSGFRFEMGTFDLKGKAIEIGGLIVFADGIVAAASTTDYAEAFLHDLIDWLRQRMGFRSPRSEPRRLFLSNIVFDLDRSMDVLIPKHTKLSKDIHKSVSKHFATDQSPRLSKIEFDFDDSSNSSGVKISGFTIERRAGVPFEVDRYFSSAPLRTQEHISLLETIEKQLT